MTPLNTASREISQRGDEPLTTARDRKAAFAALYQRYVVPIYRYFAQATNNSADAEDLTAATFSKALTSLDNYEEMGKFSSWLFSIARYTLMDYNRRRKFVDIALVEPTLSDPAVLPDAQILQAEQAGYLRSLIRQLPPAQREAVLLRFFGGLGSSDIATILGRSEGAVRMLIHRAIQTLRAKYSEER